MDTYYDLPCYLFSGDRNWSDSFIVDLIVRGLRSWAADCREQVMVVSGGARGADTLAHESAKLNQTSYLDRHSVPADWDKYHKAAGPIRNQLMLDTHNVKVVFAFHNNLEESKGTRDMVNRALKARKPVYLVQRIDPPPLREARRPVTVRASLRDKATRSKDGQT